MTTPSGWARAARGLSLVAQDGATRLLAGIASKDSPPPLISFATKHSPELLSLCVKAGSNKAALAATTSLQRASNVNLQSQNTTTTPRLDDSAVQFPESKSAATSADIYGHVEPRKRGYGGPRSSSVLLDHSANYDASQVSQSDGSQESQIDDNAEPITAYPPKDQSDDDVDTQQQQQQQHEDEHLPEGSAVPSSRFSRALGFAALGAGLAAGTAAELVRRTFGSKRPRANAEPEEGSGTSLVLSTDANAQLLSRSLRRMRGAAMKLGQMLSIQDESIAPPALTSALAQVRKGAEAMPTHQLRKQLQQQWGPGWEETVQLNERPFAAASIGQVHLATWLPSSASSPKKVAVKVQYPGVAESIDSDLSNLSMLVRATGLAPPGLFLDNVIRVGKQELKAECDYRREAANQKRFRSLISSDPEFVSDRFHVPDVIDELTTDRILVTEHVSGGTVDNVMDLEQSERNRIGRAMLRLTMRELFIWRFMQTDPNWGNFLYDVRTRTTSLIDFGAAREYERDFVRGYLNIVVANANRDRDALMEESLRMGFLTGDEDEIMLKAHEMSGFCLGEPFQNDEPYDFKSSKITSRIAEYGSVFLKHRLTPPPEEVYTLHRKLAGTYNLCIKLGAIFPCRDLLEEVIEYYEPLTNINNR